jgi:hypothetical protein
VTAHRHVVAVVGPPSAGVTSLVTVLAERLPDHQVVDGFGPDPPDAVVFVASAVAPLATSDLELLERAAARTGVMVAAVSKIDAHRGWREVLAADRALAADRCLTAPWMAVAAAPDLGAPDVDALVATLRQARTNPMPVRRNRLRANVSESRSPRSLDVIAMRGGIQRARLTLTYFMRRRCAQFSAQLRAQAAELPRGTAQRFQWGVHDAVAAFVDEVDAAIVQGVEEVANAFSLTPPEPSPPPPPPALPCPRPASRRLETRLMIVLGGGFGLGVALTLGRLMGELAPGSDMADEAGLIVGGVVGLLLTIWVVGMRGVLHDRALADRWVGDVAAMLRTCGEEMVAHQLLTAEVAFTTEIAGREPIGKPGGGRLPRRN